MAWYIRTAVLFAVLVPLSLVAADPPRAVDRFGDPPPERALMRLGTTRFRSRMVIALAFAPDGSFLATGSTDCTVRFWHAESGRQLQCWKRKEAEVHALAFAPDGKTFATAENGTLRVRETATGRDLHESPLPRGRPEALEYSADGKFLAIQVEDQSLFLQHVRDGKGVSPPAAPFPEPTLVAFSDGLRHLAALDPEQTLHVWESKTGRILGKLPKFETDGAVTLSRDGRLLAARTQAGQPIQLWEVASGKKLLSCAGQSERLRIVAFSPDGRWLASSDVWDHMIRLRDVTTGQVCWEFRPNNEAASSAALRFTADSKRLAFSGGDGLARLFDVATGRQVSTTAGHHGPISKMRFLGVEGRIVTAGVDRTIRIWDGTTGKELHQLSQTSVTQDLAGSADGKLLAVVEESSVRMLDATTGKESPVLKGRQISASSVVFSPCEAILATGGKGELCLWDTKKGELLRKLDSISNFGGPLCFSNDGRRLASGCGDGFIRVWDVESGRERAVLDGTQTGVSALAFMHDGRSLAVVGEERGLCLWEIVTRSQRPLAPLGQARISALAWSSDGRLLAYAGGDPIIHVRDVLSGREVIQFAGHDGEVTSLAFSANGLLVSGGQDSTALVWKVPTPPPAVVQKLKPNEARLLIDAMEGQSAEAAFPLMLRLASAPDLARILREYLPPATKEDGTRMVELIRDLDSNRFRVRERAAAELTKYGELAWPLLRRTLEGGPTLEMRRRVERLLEAEKDGPSPALVRRQRLLELLELRGDAEAIRVLKELAAGDPEAELTREARAGLERLSRRPR